MRLRWELWLKRAFWAVILGILLGAYIRELPQAQWHVIVDSVPVGVEDMQISWRHCPPSGGPMTITVTQQEEETLEEFHQRVQAIQDLWPNNCPE